MPELARVVDGSLAESLRRLEHPDSGREVRGDRRNHAHIVRRRRHHLRRRREVEQIRELVEFVYVAKVVEMAYQLISNSSWKLFVALNSFSSPPHSWQFSLHMHQEWVDHSS